MTVQDSLSNAFIYFRIAIYTQRHIDLSKTN
jgi:hypothetical protein